MKRIFLMLLLVLLFNSCFTIDKFDEKNGLIIVSNQTEKPIYVMITGNDSLILNEKIIYIDTTKYDYNGFKITLYPLNRVDMFKEERMYKMDLINLENEKPKIYSSDKKVRIFVLNDSLMRNLSWEDICKYQAYERKFILSEEDLDKMNSTFVYIGKDTLIYPQAQ